MKLQHKVAIITGAGGMLGPDFCAALAEHGATIATVDLNEKQAQETAKLIKAKYSVPTLGLRVDVTDPHSVEKMVDEVIRQFGSIDILVNGAAGRTKDFFASVEEYRLTDWQKVMDVNLTGTFLCCQAVGRRMKQRRTGSIINIASIYGMTAPDQRVYMGASINTPAVYSASKAGVLGLTRYLAAYWAKDGIRVNAISPGGIYNHQEEAFVQQYANRTPIGRMGQPHELRGAIAFLASDLSSYITGHNLVVDGGWTIW